MELDHGRNRKQRGGRGRGRGRQEMEMEEDENFQFDPKGVAVRAAKLKATTVRELTATKAALGKALSLGESVQEELSAGQTGVRQSSVESRSKPKPRYSRLYIGFMV